MNGSNAGVSQRPAITTYPALFLVTLATLMYETALTRIFSVTMWYHFAFVAISVALFGMTVGALIVHLRPERFRDEVLTRKLWFYSLAFAVTIPIALLTQLAIPFEPHFTANGLWSVTLTCIIISVPFIFSGIVVSLMLTRFPLRVNRLYAADLIGAALGCIALVVAFRWLDGPSLVIATGAIAAVAGLVFALGGLGRRQILGAAVAAVLIGALALGNAIALTHHHPVVKILFAKGAPEDVTPIYEKWNSFSRVTVAGNPDIPQGPSSGGFSPKMPNFQVRQLAMVIDSTAGTVMTGYNGDPRTTQFLRYDVSNLAYNLRHGGSAAIIGVGGGRDVLSALQFGDRSVTGIEINKNILDMVNHKYGNFTGHLDRDPRVHFVNDEARSWLTRTRQRFDTIQISLIDTWAASGAGAYALTENNLYTQQAWKVFLDRLHPNGILSITRWYNIPNSTEPVEILRTASLASQALTNRGVKNPRSHILIYEGPPTGPLGSASVATVLVSPRAFTPADIAQMSSVTSRLAFTPVLTPTIANGDKRFADLTAPGGPGKALGRFDFDVSPPTDNKPFFFQMASLRTLFDHPRPTNNMSIQPVQTLAVLGFAVLVMALICVLLPFVLDRERRVTRVRDRRFLPFYVFFAGIGFGFLFVEVTQLQWLSIFLGSPIYSLVVVLFSLLLFSGIGSAVTERIIRPTSRISLIGPLVAVVVVVTAVGIATPAVIHGAAAYTTPARILVSLALLAPLGLTMGMPFAIGMRMAGELEGSPTAFMWAINGATSVCASVFAVVLAVFLGIQLSYFAGVAAYVVAMSAMVSIARRPVREEEPISVPAAEPDLATVSGS